LVVFKNIFVLHLFIIFKRVTILAVKKKTSKKSSGKNKAKKIEIVFEDSKKVVKKSKPVKHTKKSIVKKKQKPVVHVAEVVKTPEVKTPVVKTSEHKTHKTKARKKSNDFLIIGVLVFLIIAIIIASFLIPSNQTGNTVNDNSDLNSNVVDGNLIDANQVADINVDDFQNRALELNLKILNDMASYQQNILSGFYTDLNLDSNQMNTCISNNKYLEKDANMFSFKEVSEIQKDFLLSQDLYVFQTPTMFVNGYQLAGFKDYNTVTDFISSVKDTENLDLNYLDKSFVVDDNSLKLYVVYDVDNKDINKANTDFIDYLKNSETLVQSVRDVFTDIFTKSNVEYVQYNSLKGKSILQTIDANILPAYYLTGNVDSLDFNSDVNKSTVFDLIFSPEPVNNGLVMKQDVFLQFYSGLPIDGTYKLINYKSIVDENTTFLGEKDAKTSVVLFTDYDDPNSLKLENETLTNEFYTDFVDTGEVSVVIKPIVTNDVFSIYPILFLKCAENQNGLLKTHKKIFELNSIIGVTTVYDTISQKYADELAQLQDEYSKITGTVQGN